jgi:hypothetical protein
MFRATRLRAVHAPRPALCEDRTAPRRNIAFTGGRVGGGLLGGTFRCGVRGGFSGSGLRGGFSVGGSFGLSSDRLVMPAPRLSY